MFKVCLKPYIFSDYDQPLAILNGQNGQLHT